MPDHVHLFVCGDAEFRLGRWIAMRKQALAKACSRLPAASGEDVARSESVESGSPLAPPTGRRLQRAESVQPAHTIWQRGFFDHVLRKDESYGQKWTYVRDNPVRAGLVANADDWPYAGEIIYIDRA